MQVCLKCYDYDLDEKGRCKGCGLEMVKCSCLPSSAKPTREIRKQANSASR